MSTDPAETALIDPTLLSWVTSANDPASDFPLQNLPFGRFRRTALCSPCAAVSAFCEILQVHLAAHHVRQLVRFQFLGIGIHIVHLQFHVLRVALGQGVNAVLHQLHPGFHHVLRLGGGGGLHLHPAVAVGHNAHSQ